MSGVSSEAVPQTRLTATLWGAFFDRAIEPQCAIEKRSPEGRG